jgi:hypothetical protein
MRWENLEGPDLLTSFRKTGPFNEGTFSSLRKHVRMDRIVWDEAGGNHRDRTSRESGCKEVPRVELGPVTH